MDFRELMLEQKRLVLDKSVLDNFPNRRSASEDIPPFLTKFTLPKDYKGDFGFDKWSSEFLLNGQPRNIETSLSHVIHGNDLQLSVDYFKNIKKGDKRPPHYDNYLYNAAFLCVKNGQKADINLQLLTPDNKGIDFNIDDLLYFEGVNSEYINVKVNNIPLTQETIPVKGLTNTVHYLRTMKCNNCNNSKAISITIELADIKGSYIDAETRMSIYYKKKDESHDKLITVGEIVLCPNRPITVPVRVMVCERFIEDYASFYNKDIETIKSRLRDHLNTKSISHAAINFDVKFLPTKPFLGPDYDDYINDKGFVKDIVFPNQNQNEAKQVFDEFGNLVNLNGNVIKFKSLDLKLLDLYQKTVLSKDIVPFNGITIFLTPLLGSEGGFVRGTCKEMTHAMIYTRQIFKGGRPLLDIEHEIGHILGLLHSFPPGNSLKELHKAKNGLETWLEENRKDANDKFEKVEKTDSDKLAIVEYSIKSRDYKNQKTNLDKYFQQRLFFEASKTNNIMDYADYRKGNNLLNPTSFFWQWKIMRERAISIKDKNY